MSGFVAGVYDRMPEDMYHADPVPDGSLSASGAKKLLAPSCPARFKYERDNPQPSTAAQEKGTAAHELVLGTGRGIVKVEADSWRTNKARAAGDEARAEGKTPLLAAEYAEVQEMAAALRAHPIASALFNPDAGKPEQSIFWQDDEYGIWRRARFDWLPTASARSRLIIGDYKTCRSADPDSISKAVYDYGYFMQDPWYRDAARAVGLDEDPAFVFVFQEKNPPYLVTVTELDFASIETGRRRNRMAIEIYRDCTESGIWPGYSKGIDLISLPPWAIRHLEEAAA